MPEEPEVTPTNNLEKPLLLEFPNFDKILIELKLRFNLPLATTENNSNFETLVLTLGNTFENSKPIKPESFKMSSSKKTLIIKLNFSRTVSDEFVFIDSKTKLEIKTKDQQNPDLPPTYYTEYPIKIPVSYFSTSLDTLISEQGQSSSTAVSAFTIILLLGSSQAALILVKLF